MFKTLFKTLFKKFSDRIDSIKIDDDFNNYNSYIEEYHTIYNEILNANTSTLIDGPSSLSANSKKKLITIVDDKKEKLRNKFFKKVDFTIMNSAVCSLDIYDIDIEYFTFNFDRDRGYMVIPLGTYESYNYKGSFDTFLNVNVYYHLLTFSKDTVRKESSSDIQIFVKKEIELSTQNKDVYKLYSLYLTYLNNKIEQNNELASKEISEAEKQINELKQTITRKNDPTEISEAEKQIIELEQTITRKKKLIEKNNDKHAQVIEDIQTEIKPEDIPTEILDYSGSDELLKKIKNKTVLNGDEFKKIINAPLLLNLLLKLFPPTGGKRKRPSRKTKRSSKKSKKTRRNNRKR